MSFPMTQLIAFDNLFDCYSYVSPKLNPFSVRNQRSLLVRGRRHHPDHPLRHPLHHAQDEGAGGKDLPAGQSVYRFFAAAVDCDIDRERMFD